MTNEEAIKKVSMVKMLAVKSSTDTAVAMDMAIKALENEYGLTLALEQSNASNEYLNNSVSELGETINILKDEIKRLKEQQPKKGEWLKDYTYRKDHPRNYCSVCNMTGGFRTDYCPNCGAYMRKDGEQG